MDSGSPRRRVDQFFASKKKRAFSPKLAKDSSPGAKGSLASYLVDDGSSATQGPAKRKLALGLDLPSEVEKKETILPNDGRVRVLDSSQAVPSGVCRANGVDTGAMVNSSSNPVSVGPQNLELKQFAADFLSLYCGELHSSSLAEKKSNEHRRHGSPPMPVLEGKPFNKRHCNAHGDKPQPDDPKNSSVTKRNFDVIPCGNIAQKTETIVSCSKEDDRGNCVSKAQMSLKKCSNTTNSNPTLNECSTPAGSRKNSSARETPISGRGSSMFSPGEEFWNEAIQVADGLFAQTGNILSQMAEDTNVDKIKNDVNSHNFGEGSSADKLNVPVADGSSCFRQSEVNIFLSDKHAKTMDKKASPLPVKHLDFSREGKNLDESTEQEPSSDNRDDSKRDSKYAKCSSPNHKRQLIRSLVPASAVVQSHEVVPKVLETGPTCGANKVKSNSLSQGSNNTLSPPPSKEDMNVNAFGISDGTSSPSSSVPLESRLDLSTWLPSAVCNTYRRKGIMKLYSWQVDCLEVDGVLQKRNLVYCASTSAGKSFVAEILMLRRVIETGKMALLVLPYVSICVEKAEHLEFLLEPLGKHVRSYYGNQGGGTLPKDTSVAVCTIEKANSLINRLLEEDRLSEVGIIVIDELHMVADPNRGYLLELLLTKLRYASGEGNVQSSSGESSGTSSGKGDQAHGLQIVGMSATMPNVSAVADWLHAALYQTEFRPVPLEEFIKVGNSIYDKKMELVRTLPRSAELGGKDPDHVVELCNEVVQDGNSVLIFCSSRKGCEATARHVSTYLKKFSAKIQEEESDFADIFSAIDALRRCPVGLDPVLQETLPSGVAYHHAGLTVEEREIVETCYRKGLVRVLTATSTLAAGVNLPARRVIFRQPKIGRDFIDGTRYKQMSGRAGRTGIDAKGESVLICRPEEMRRIKALLNDSCPPLQSCLSEDKNGMTHAILEVVASGIVQTANDIHRYVRCTLLNSTKPFEDVVKSAQDSLRWLCHRKFLEWNVETKLYSTTPLGRASFGSSLSPEESLIVLDDLSRAREGFVLASDLHLVYLSTPINVEVEPDWEQYYARFMELPSLDQSVGNRVGVVEPFLMRMAHGAPLRTASVSRNSIKGLHGRIDSQLGVSKSHTLTEDQSLRVCRRFYVALILSRLVQEVPVGDVCEAFKVARGMVQALQENAGRFASMVSVFCERLGWHDIEGLIAKFQNRVSFGVRAEIVELTTIPYVKGSRARALYKAGLRTPLAIAESSVTEVAKALFEAYSWAAQENVAQRRMQLGVAKKIKNAARKIVLDKAEEARAAAFSAFQSLGLNVPQLSRPLLPTVSCDISTKDETSTPAEFNKSSSTRYKKQVESTSVDCSVRKENKRTSATDVVISRNVLNVGLETSAKGKEMRAFPSASDVQHKSITAGDAVIKEGQRWHQENDSRENKKSSNDKGPINVASASGLDSFLDLWECAREFYFDIHFNKRSEVHSLVAFEVLGVAISWENSPVYYVNLPKALLSSEVNMNSPNDISGQRSLSDPNILLDLANRRWDRICRIMGSCDARKFTWNLKIQVQVLKNAFLSLHRNSLSQTFRNTGIEHVDGSFYKLPQVSVEGGIDLCIVAWILWPDDERSSNPSLEKEVKKRLSSETAAAANQNGRWKNQMRRAAHNGCCRRVAQTRGLHSVLWKLIVSEELVEVLLDIEIPLVQILADMEVLGIGVDMEGCLKARHILSKKLRMLEKEAYKLAGTTFSLHMPADVANVLYGHLKLPIPEGHNKGKHHASTDKHCLDLLRLEHPVVPVIKEYRTLSKLLNCTLGSMCSMAKLSMRTQKYTIHGHWLQTSTATGRLSMEEPNLQCVEHMVEFTMCENAESEGDSCTKHYKINARDFFVSTEENWVLLTADYSQIELRIMAHFSKDPSLIELLSNPQGDVFTMIASRWTGKLETNINSQERDQTKRLVYGILYGMGPNSLGEQMNCSADEAKAKIQSFKSSFGGVASWLQEAVAFCRQRGYVQTLKGRKRFLSKIKIGNNKEKAKAERQAVNSICQGSAADIIKIAMINLYSVISADGKHNSTHELATKFSMLKGHCRILLQVHDELVLEVDPCVLREAGMLLKTCMESAASLLVPLLVKLKFGRTWGSLEAFNTE